MATPTRKRHRLGLADGVVDVDVVSTAGFGHGPAVLLVGALGTAPGARASQRLARAGFTAIACGDVGAEVAGAIAARLRADGVDGVTPSSLAVISLPLVPDGEDEDEALDAVVRDLASHLT
jgi:hypothetical protein